MPISSASRRPRRVSRPASDHGKCLSRRLRCVWSQLCPLSLGLDDDHAEGVADDVVQLASDAHTLVLYRPLGVVPAHCLTSAEGPPGRPRNDNHQTQEEQEVPYVHPRVVALLERGREQCVGDGRRQHDPRPVPR